MQCEWCRREIPLGGYIRYKGKPFCDSDCLGEYLIDEHEEDIQWNCWKDTPENDRIIAAEEKEAIRKDLAHEW
jgi:hypothetical protein